MNKTSQFKTVSRHYAVQTLFNACYAETLQVTASFLKRDKPACACRPGEVVRGLQAQGLLPDAALGALRDTCTDCRRALERAAQAWEAGDAETLRECLAAYRQAAGAVRLELRRLAG
ncbi:hypothetical protein [Azospira restricta]|uniref:Uncharacterized protein n=1 Tax=Azospira restricta TaxID=404405 RepID=A0A974Y3U7_9RHOO|nr:hypothetical protein [Azospira restricta]QRJ64085.1 hypothetical protein IWH25_01640 [Azospira restricta]